MSRPHRDDASAPCDRHGPLTLSYLARLLGESIRLQADAANARRRGRLDDRRFGCPLSRCDRATVWPSQARTWPAENASKAAWARLIRAEERLAPKLLDGSEAEDLAAKRRGGLLFGSDPHDASTSLFGRADTMVAEAA